jgi:hypothetical protein
VLCFSEELKDWNGMILNLRGHLTNLVKVICDKGDLATERKVNSKNE